MYWLTFPFYVKKSYAPWKYELYWNCLGSAVQGHLSSIKIFFVIQNIAHGQINYAQFNGILFLCSPFIYNNKFPDAYYYYYKTFESVIHTNFLRAKNVKKENSWVIFIQRENDGKYEMSVMFDKII